MTNTNKFVDFDVVIAGAGVIGLALAYTLSKKGYQCLVVDKNPSFGEETSSRHSEVVHAGIYYEPNSLKSKLCIEGKDLIYKFCDAHSVRYKKIGKYIIASDKNQDKKLRKIQENAQKCNMNDLFYKNNKELEKDGLSGIFSALYSPSTGIIDSHDFMLKLLKLITENGSTVAFNTPVENVSFDDNKINVFFGDQYHLKCRFFINASGLHAVDTAKRIENISHSLLPQNNYAKGTYFKIFKKTPYRNLIYPLPEEGGLGIHLTHDLDGNVKFGPDVEYIDTIDYQVAKDKKNKFYNSIKAYLPDLNIDDLHADYCGIRPKISFDGKTYDDFFISNELVKGNKNIVNIMGIESPGFTSSLAIAKYVLSKYL